MAHESAAGWMHTLAEAEIEGEKDFRMEAVRVGAMLVARAELERLRVPVPLLDGEPDTDGEDATDGDTVKKAEALEDAALETLLEEEADEDEEPVEDA
jgi:hypothetical protein